MAIGPLSDENLQELLTWLQTQGGLNIQGGGLEVSGGTTTLSGGALEVSGGAINASGGPVKLPNGDALIFGDGINPGSMRLHQDGSTILVQLLEEGVPIHVWVTKQTLGA